MDEITPYDALAPYLDEARHYVRQARAAHTLKAYQSDWRRFEGFCQGRGVAPLPATPSTVAAYLAEAARTLKANTVERHLTAISQAHQMAGVANPAEDKLVPTRNRDLFQVHVSAISNLDSRWIAAVGNRDLFQIHVSATSNLDGAERHGGERGQPVSDSCVSDQQPRSAARHDNAASSGVSDSCVSDQQPRST